MTISKGVKEFQFGIRHIILIFVITLTFLAISAYINNLTKNKLVNNTAEIYRKTSIENLADLTATSLELLLEQLLSRPDNSEEWKQEAVHGFDMILSQQALRENIEELCIMITYNDQIFAIDSGHELYAYYLRGELPPTASEDLHEHSIALYRDVSQEIASDQSIMSFFSNNREFQILVPVIIKGNFSSVLYMRIGVDYSSLIREITIGYSNTSIIFTVLIMLGLLSMFYLSSYMVSEREEALYQLFDEQQLQLKQNVELQKEHLFARRIYHTHHKAEKIMGYIKNDLRSLNPTAFKKQVDSILKFASYIQRVIYDMKSFNPPVNTIRNPAFQSNLNEIIVFIVDHIFGRHEKFGNLKDIVTEFDSKVPIVHINEYVIWEILEPLIHNSIDHNPEGNVQINISIRYNEEKNSSRIDIIDDGVGFNESMLESNDEGVQKLFLENTSSKSQSDNSGYGCYIAYQISLRCAWRLSATNTNTGGAQITVHIPHAERY